MFVRSKFVCVYCLWKLCARTHAHSLEGALDTTHHGPHQIGGIARGEQVGQVPAHNFTLPPSK